MAKRYLEEQSGNGSFEPAADLSNWADANDPWILGWGTLDRGQISTPLGYGAASAFDGGLLHTVALYPNGTVRAWGDNTWGQTNVPASLTNVVAVSAAWNQSAAVTVAGQIITWPSTNAIPAQPSAYSDFVSVALGWQHGLGLRANGSVVTWGSTNDWASTNYPGGLSNVRAIASGWQHNAALLWDGTVRCWGANFGPLGWNTTNVPAAATNVIAIAAGAYHTLALKSDGTVIAWGAGNAASTNTFFADKGQSIVPASATNVIAIAAGGYQSMALRADGSLVTWGELGSTPAGITNIVAIGAGDGHCLAQRIRGQAPVIIEQPYGGCTKIGATNIVFAVRAIGPALSYQWQFNSSNIAGGTNYQYAISNVQSNNLGNYHAVVSNASGSVTSQDVALTLGAAPVFDYQSLPTNYSLLYGESLSLSARATNLENCLPPAYICTLNGAPVPLLTGTNVNIEFANNENSGIYVLSATNAAGGASVSWNVDIAGEGNVIEWGYQTSSPYTHITGLTNATGLAAGALHALALREDGTVLSWGFNGSGQTNVPPTATNVVQVSGGYYHSLALRSDGAVIGWGLNSDGQTNPPDVGTNKVIAISAGSYHNLAKLENSTVFQWGATTGPLPNNLASVKEISAGYTFDMALLSNGTVIAWGSNTYGQTNVPAVATGAVAIAAGDAHALALRSDGTVVSWGLNNFGQTSVPPVLTNPATANVISIAAGAYHSMALRNNGTVVAWGWNGRGQTNTPANLTNVHLIASSCSSYQSLAAIDSSWIQYPIDVSKDLLLIYNTNSANSRFVKDYYLQHRPGVADANILAIACPAQETVSRDGDTNINLTSITAPIAQWLSQNPTKRPKYWLLCYDIPTRINVVTNVPDYPDLNDPIDNSVSFELSSTFGNPFVLNLNGTDTNSVKAYIDKLEFFSTNNNHIPKLIISPSQSGYANTNFVLDNIRHGATYPQDDYSSFGDTISVATNALLAAGVSPAAIQYTDNLENITNGIPTNYTHPTGATNLAGYICWGFHSSLGSEYSYDGKVQWGTNCQWWIMMTVESFNGQRAHSGSGRFTLWLEANAFGGTNYSNAPIGMVCHTDEPFLLGVSDSGKYFGLWASKKNFAITAWHSRKTQKFQAIGDPFITR